MATQDSAVTKPKEYPTEWAWYPDDEQEVHGTKTSDPGSRLRALPTVVKIGIERSASRQPAGLDQEPVSAA